MKFTEWLRTQFIGKTKIEISAEEMDRYIDAEKMNELCTTEFFTLMAISLYSNIVSNCEMRTVMHGQEIRGEEYYLWNYEPNRNQSAVDLKKEIIDKLFRNNECLLLDIGGQLICADGYVHNSENVLWDQTFEHVSKGTLTFERPFFMRDVMFFRLNNRNIRGLLDSITQGYKTVAQNALENYEKANGRKGIMHIDSAATNRQYSGKSFSEIYEELLNNRFQKYFKAKNAVLPLFQGFEYEEKNGGTTNYQNIASDYSGMINECAAKTALAFNIPPGLFVGNVSGLKDAVNDLISFGVDPFCNAIDTEINRKRYGKAVLNNCYMWTDTTSVLHIDLFEAAKNIDKLISSGFTNIDELRKRAGLLQLNTEWSRRYYMTKNYQTIESMKGGKGDAGNNE